MHLVLIRTVALATKSKTKAYNVHVSSNKEQQLQLLNGNCSIIMLIDTNIAKAIYVGVSLLIINVCRNLMHVFHQ
jgi:hypothetical protein